MGFVKVSPASELPPKKSWKRINPTYAVRNAMPAQSAASRANLNSNMRMLSEKRASFTHHETHEPCWVEERATVARSKDAISAIPRRERFREEKLGPGPLELAGNFGAGAEESNRE